MSLPYARNTRGEVAVGGPQGVFDGRMPTAPGTCTSRRAESPRSRRTTATAAPAACSPCGSPPI